jgi:hypothetical protein
MACSYHPPQLHHFSIFDEAYKVPSSSCCFLQPLLHFTVPRPDVLLSTLFSNTLGLRSSINFRDQVPHSWKITDKTKFLYI